MDPIAAFGLAVNILTVIDVSIKIISKAREIHISGNGLIDSHRDLVAQDLKGCCLKLTEAKTKATSGQGGVLGGIIDHDSNKLHQLAYQAMMIAEDLSKSLAQPRPNASVSKSLWLAVVEVWGADKTEEKTKQLGAIRNELQFHVIVSMKNQVDVIALKESKELQTLDEHSGRMINAVLTGNDTTRAQLGQHINSLNKRLEGTHTFLEKVHAEQTSQADHNHAEQMEALRGLASHVQIPEEVYVPTIVRRILNALTFPRMYDRFDDIKPAHANTCQWIFSGMRRNNASSCTFMEWIAGDKGVYWISGKAGSGKSTLMKYLRQNSQFKQAFESWSGEHKLITVSYWFWDQGQDSKQYTLQGLLQAVFHGLIDQEPAFAPLLFPDQFIVGHDWENFPTSHELMRGFRRLVSMESPPAHVGILIDGLDEFTAPEEEQFRLAEQLKAAAFSKHLKIVVSSRPEDAFETTFKDCEKLRLHELTFQDRTTYTRDRLRDHEYTGVLRAHTPDGQAVEDALINSVVEKSEGIFLWLQLVVGALGREMKQCDDLTQLQTILDQFPRGLEKLFASMLRRIPEDRRTRGYRLIQLVQRSRALSYLQTDEYGQTPPAITARILSAANDDLRNFVDTDVGTLVPDKLEHVVRKVDNQLRMNCAGLLEMKEQTSGRHIHDIYRDPEVVFVHRSVLEWLGVGKYVDLFPVEEVTSFDVDLSLMKGFLMKVKVTRSIIPCHVSGNRFQFFHPQLWSYIERIIRFAGYAELANSAPVQNLLDELERSVTELKRSANRLMPTEWAPELQDRFRSLHWTYFHPWDSHFRDSEEHPGREFADENSHGLLHCGFLSFTIKIGLEQYPLSKLGRLRLPLPLQILSDLLRAACDTNNSSPLFPCIIRPAVVRELLRLGADPNEGFASCTFCGSSAWNIMLLTLHKLPFINLRGASQFAELVRVFLEHGADPCSPLKSNMAHMPSPRQVIERAFIDIFDREDKKSSCRRSIPTLGTSSDVFVYYENLEAFWWPADYPSGERDGLVFERKRLTPAEARIIQNMGKELIRLLNEKEREKTNREKAGGSFVKLRKHVKKANSVVRKRLTQRRV